MNNQNTTENNTMNGHRDTTWKANMNNASSCTTGAIRATACFTLVFALAASAIAGPTAAAGKLAAKPIAKAASREVVEKAAREAAEKATREVGEKIAREAAEKAARDAAAKAASRSVGKTIVRTVAKPKVLLATGAGTAAVVASHNVSTGARNAIEDVGESVKEVAEKRPEALPKVIKEVARPVRAIANAVISLVILPVVLFVLWFLMPMLHLVRTNVAIKAKEAACEASNRNDGGRSTPEDGVIDAEYEMRD